MQRRAVDRIRFGLGVTVFGLATMLATCASPGNTQRECSDTVPCPNGDNCILGRCVPWDSSVSHEDAETSDAFVGTDGSQADAGPCLEAHFERTDTQEVITVPPTVSYMHVKAWGAGGNEERGCESEGYIDGGVGGYSEAVFAVSPGDTIVVFAGHNGRADPTNPERFGFGTWGGGGLSGVFRGPGPIEETDADQALVIAGGGGSAGDPGDGCFRGGNGNAADSGGMNTMRGGTGASDYNGGAGGYAGGLGGEYRRQSKGGSGYIAPEAVDSRMEAAGATEDLPPNSTDDDYVSSGIEGIGMAEHDGYVVIKFLCTPPVVQ